MNWLVDIVLLFVSVYVLLYKYFARNFDYWKERKVPFITPTAFYGNFKEVSLFKVVAGEHLANLYNKMKGHQYFGIFVFDKPVLVLRDPNLIKTILVKDFNYFADRTSNVIEKDQPLVANMLFFSKNPAWKIMRTHLTPAFTSGKLKGMVPLMNEAGEDMKIYLNKHSTGTNCLEAKEICAQYSTDVVASCAFGINAHSFDRKDPVFRKMGRMIFDFNISNAIQQSCSFFAPEIANLLKMKFVHKDVASFLTETLLKTIEERETAKHKRNDLVDIIIEMKNKSNFSGDFKLGELNVYNFSV